MVTGTNDRYLKKEVAIPLAYEIMEPSLIWGNFVRKVKEDTNAFLYRYDSTNKSSDSKKKTPPIHLLGGQFPEIDKSRKVTASALIEAQGFSMRLPRNVVREKTGRSEIMEAYETAGFWLAEIVNTNILSAMTTGATTSFTAFSPDATWDDATAAPITDLRHLAQDMDREGYPFRLTDVFLNKAGWYELGDYLTSVDITELKQLKMYGMPEIGKDVISVPMIGDVHKVMSGMTDGYLLGLDRNNPGAELHYYNDPKYAVPTISYKTKVDGKQTRLSVPNMGFNFSQYEEDDTHDTVLQFWVENKTVVKKPLGILYGSGI